MTFNFNNFSPIYETSLSITKISHKLKCTKSKGVLYVVAVIF